MIRVVLIVSSLAVSSLVVSGCCTDAGCIGVGDFELLGPLNRGERVTFDIAIGETEGSCAGVVGEELTCTGALIGFSDEGDFPVVLQYMNPGPDRTANIVVTIDDVVVLDETARLRISPGRPNGPLCGVACYSFSHDLWW